MPETPFDPVPIARVVPTGCMEVANLAFTAAEKAVVCFSPVEWLIVPFVNGKMTRWRSFASSYVKQRCQVIFICNVPAWIARDVDF